MQHRALIEPHAPNPYVRRPRSGPGDTNALCNSRAKKPTRKTKEYEKHSYKRFDRDF